LFSGGVQLFVFDRWDVSEVLVQAAVVVPADVLDDGEFELAARPPDAVADQLGLEAVDERLGERIVIRVADRSDGGEDAVVGERLGVVDARVLPEFNRWSRSLWWINSMSAPGSRR
jgi:hypothetical protein